MSLEIIAAGMKMWRENLDKIIEIEMNMGNVKGKVFCKISFYSLCDFFIIYF